MKFFIVSVDSDATTAQRDAFTLFLRTNAKGAGFWHDISHTWLIRDGSMTLTVVNLRAKLGELMPGVAVIVIEAQPTNYSAISVETGHEWLKNHVVTKS